MIAAVGVGCFAARWPLPRASFGAGGNAAISSVTVGEGMAVEPVGGSEANGLFMSLRQTLVVLAATVMLSGCGSNAVTTWTAHFPSPDGRWVAVARTYRYSGPGNDYVDTCLYLRSGYGDEKEVMVLSYAGIGSEMSVRWTAPSHLEVKLRKHVEIDFEAVIFSTVTITVRNFSGEGSQ